MGTQVYKSQRNHRPAAGRGALRCALGSTVVAGMKPGDRVMVIGAHPWAGNAGTLIAFEKYGLGWTGWRVKLDGNCGECYANENELSVPRVDSIRITYRKRKVKR